MQGGDTWHLPEKTIGGLLPRYHPCQNKGIFIKVRRHANTNFNPYKFRDAMEDAWADQQAENAGLTYISRPITEELICLKKKIQKYTNTRL